MHRDGDRLLQLLIFNEEFLVSACHQRALITSLPFVHTARRSYRLNDPVRPPDWGNAAGSPAAMPREAVQTLLFRGRRSRNKVSVGEPAEGSLSFLHPHPCVLLSSCHSPSCRSLPERCRLCALGPRRRAEEHPASADPHACFSRSARPLLRGRPPLLDVSLGEMRWLSCLRVFLFGWSSND